MPPVGLRVYMTAIAMFVASVVARRVVPPSQAHGRAKHGDSRKAL